MIQSYHLLRQFTAFTHELVFVTLLLCSCGLVFCFVFCLGCVFVFWVFFVGLLCFSVRFGDDIVTVHRTMCRSFISSLLRPLTRPCWTEKKIHHGIMVDSWQSNGLISIFMCRTDFVLFFDF